LLLLIHSRSFRRQVADAGVLLWRAARGLFYDLPVGFLSLGPVRAFFTSRAYVLVYLWVIKPLIWAALVFFTLYLVGVNLLAAAAGAAGMFLAVSLLLHSRLGMRLEEAAGDWAARGWRLVRVDLLPGLFRLVLYFFRRLVEYVERLLYTVDEWLRFRGGDTRWSLAVKAALGLIWFVFTYFIRFILNLVAEPQLNPIKHFPMVTVAHKMVFLAIPSLIDPLKPAVGETAADLVGVALQFILPGIVGFLVWELKENWKLYRANQSATLRPQVVGSHGEKVPGLLRPGFHSGTLPKCFARLRRVKGAAAGKQDEALHHVQEAVRRFVERRLTATLAGAKSWDAAAPVEVGRVRLGCNRIRVELRRAGPAGAVFLDLEEHAGRLVAGLTPAPAPAGEAGPAHGWLDRLPLGQLRAFADALAGFYKAAGVDLVREQVADLLPPAADFVFDDHGNLVVRGPDGADVAYHLAEAPRLPPHVAGAGPAPAARTLSADRLLFGATPVRWEDWVEAWERDQAGKPHKPPLLRGVRLLPAAAAKARLAARRKR
jgi:hypothetical protein